MTDRHTQNGSSHDGDRFPEELLTAYALGQLEGAERGAVERMLANEAQDEARRTVAHTQRLAGELPKSLASGNLPSPSPELREAVLAGLDGEPAAAEPSQVELAGRRRWLGLTWIQWAAAGGLACLLAFLFLPPMQVPQRAARRMENSFTSVEKVRSGQPRRETTNRLPDFTFTQDEPLTNLPEPTEPSPLTQPSLDRQIQAQTEAVTSSVAGVDATPIGVGLNEFGEETAPKNDLLASVGSLSGSGISGRGEPKRPGMVMAAGGSARPSPSVAGGPGGAPQSSGQGQPGTPFYDQNTQHYFHDQRVATDPKKGESIRMAVTPRIVVNEEEEERLAAGTEPARGEIAKLVKERDHVEAIITASVVPGKEGQIVRGHAYQIDNFGTEQYEPIHENVFLAPRQNPLSTFSIDVDTASYANMRRFLTGGSLPPANAVRIEELVNYFRYDYPQPKGPEPFSVNMEVAECPWADSHLLLRVGLKGKDVHRGERPASNLVFLLDVSGSMADANKLPLLKTAMQMFAAELGENDRVSIVTYAGEAGLRLPPTRGHEYEKIRTAIESLSSGGSTNGSAGIELAYEQAKAYFAPGGTNRVILCTDGDLNVGITDDEALVQLIKQKATSGTFLTVLGFGEGNLKDAKMEKLADNGNGLYAYIDSVREARKVLVEQMTGSMITIAKDVKIQIEFNPAQVASYRLLGYENRVLAAQDFNDDKKDAGEIGAGHTVTALYELVPVGAKPEQAAPQPGVQPLKYQETGDSGQEPVASSQEPAKLTEAAKSGELLTLKLRYKEPAGQESKLLEVPLKDRGGKFNAASKDLQFSAAVAGFGMILRGSEHKGSASLAAVEEIASGAIGEDAGGYRAELVDLVRKAASLGVR
jgi:Ca-activated chloride channel family protein